MYDEQVSNLEVRVRTALLRADQVREVRLIGSRATGTPTPLSDWDFRVETEDFASVGAEIPGLVDALNPISQQWDRLSDSWCYMLLLRGAVKVDLIFDEPHKHERPWSVSPTSLTAIDAHFWDWTLWLASKQSAGQDELVRHELLAMHEHLLRPMDAGDADSLQGTVDAYLQARGALEQRFEVAVPRDVENEVLRVVRTLPPP
jgi:hypothetical protein